MPDFDFDAFNHDEVEEYGVEGSAAAAEETSAPEVKTNGVAPKAEPVVIAPVAETTATNVPNNSQEEVDKW